MAFKLGERVRETSTTTGTTDFTLGGAPAGFQTFDDILTNGDTTWYMAALGTEWEMGVGTFNSGVLQRTTVLASSAGGTTKVTFSAGEKAVFCTPPAVMLAKLDLLTVTEATDLDEIRAFVEGGGGAVTPDIQTFSASGTWTKPAGNYRLARVRIWGGAGGGGSGRRAATGSQRGGGAAGGGSGLPDERWYLLTELGSTESVTIGAGGTGGAGRTTNTVDGNPGSDGGNSSFGSHVTAYGGKGGSGGGTGTTAGGRGGGISSDGQYVLGTTGPDVFEGGGTQGGGSIYGGGGGGGTATPGHGGGSVYGGGGGGGGQSINSSNVVVSTSLGAGGGRNGKGTGASPGASNAAANGSNGGDWEGGGGGSAIDAGTSAGNGGNGGRGGGGGGGAGSTNGTTSGAGGDGGDGYAEITCF